MNVRVAQGRRRSLRVAVAVPLVGVLAVALAGPAGASNAAASSPLPAASSSATDDQGTLQTRLRRAFGASSDDVSVAVHDRRTGRFYTYNADLENATGSIVKAMVLTALIRERRADGRGLSDAQKALAQRMIRQSDNDATTSLLRQAGGPDALAGLATEVGMKHTTTAASWGRTSTTASDQVALMDAIVSPSSTLLSSADRSYVLGLMGSVSDEQAWGVGKVPSGAKAQVKNGWVPLEPRGWRVNSIGHVTGQGRDYTMAVLSYDNASMDAGVKHMNDASTIVFEELGGDTASVRESLRAGLASLSQPRPLW